MKKYEAIIILNPNLSSKADNFVKDFEKTLKANSFSIKKFEDIGRRQLSYSISNHNKGHYLLFNLEGDPTKLTEIENKIKYDESIIRHLFIGVREHSGKDSQLFIDSKNNKSDKEEIEESSNSNKALETASAQEDSDKSVDDKSGNEEIEEKSKIENVDKESGDE